MFGFSLFLKEVGLKDSDLKKKGAVRIEPTQLSLTTRCAFWYLLRWFILGWFHPRFCHAHQENIKKIFFKIKET
jgi:hypothetical protein